ncbi:MAG: carboxymuconolactone decarboxylase family protein [Rhodopirellula sp.]|nr:carboxymuconolactone decarboxylase family protein [Rhodopirellula sp.]
MSRLQPVQRDRTDGKTRKILDEVQSSMGMTPNLFRIMANSPAVLEGFVSLRNCLENGVLEPSLREQVCLSVAEANRSEYCVAGHAAIGKTIGLSDEEIMDARHAQSPDSKVQAALAFAWEVADHRGDVMDSDIIRLRDAGYTEEEIAEIIGLVGLNTFGDYFAEVTQPAFDFPRVPEPAHA